MLGVTDFHVPICRHQYFVGHQVLVMVMGGSSSSSWEKESSCLSAAAAAVAALVMANFIPTNVFKLLLNVQQL
jgi:hypothetical protein